MSLANELERVLVCGSRSLHRRALVRITNDLRRIKEQRGVELVIEGGAPGADSLAAEARPEASGYPSSKSARTGPWDAAPAQLATNACSTCIVRPGAWPTSTSRSRSRAARPTWCGGARRRACGGSWCWWRSGLVNNETGRPFTLPNSYP
jgi:hypothetical protein